MCFFLTDCASVVRCDVWWFMTVSVSDEADISRHHKSRGWARSGEVSHTGSSRNEFPLASKLLQGNKALKLSSGRGKTSFSSLWDSAACESSPTITHMLLHLSPRRWCDHLQSSDRAGTFQQHARSLTRANWTPPFCRKLSWSFVRAAFLIIVSPGISAPTLRWGRNWFIAALHPVFNSISECSGRSCLLDRHYRSRFMHTSRTLFTLRSG